MNETAAAAIAKGLAGAGCRHAFGMPGGEVLVLLDALEHQGIRFTLCKHENAAGYMAEGTWQKTGAPGILLTTIGPGLANGVNSIANAYQEQVPLIVLSGCIDRGEAEGFTHQVIDQTAMLAPLTKAQFRVAEGSASLVISKAIAIAMADPPGPVHVDLPHNLASAAAGDAPPAALAPVPGIWPQGESLEKAATMLSRAERPVLIAGLGAVHHNAGEAIRQICEKYSMPMVSTYKAKGILDENHPLCFGGHGLSPLSDKSVLPLLAASDCVVLAGYDPIEMRSGWRNPWNAEVAIDIAHAPCYHGMHGASVSFIGDVAASLSVLSTAASPRAKVWPDNAPENARKALQGVFAERSDWGPHQVFSTLNGLMPKGAIATVDSGAHRILLSQMWRCSDPGTLLQSSAFCTMGVAVPLAAGVAVAIQADGETTPVVAFVGDAGFEMGTGELATFRDLKLPIIIVVLVDESLALIDLKQRRTQLPENGVGFGATDFVRLAEAMGGHGAWIENNTDLTSEFLDACDRIGFSLLACKIDKQHYDGAF